MNEACEPSRALVLFSGGQDSATCLAWALKTFDHVETVAFDYGQRHHVELECRQHFIKSLHDVPQTPISKLGEDHLITLEALGTLSDTSLTRERAIEMSASGLPSTFVPGRNLIFLTFAAALAYRRNCRHIVLGVCETDYSGYPDCRDDTIKAMQVALNLGLEQRFVLHTPLMWRDKAQTFELAQEIGGQALVDSVLEHTHTCYMGNRTMRHTWGYGCGTCPACKLRKTGFERWMHKNPTSQS
jgi:7-cyano-7-deazaguanine synthase